jgi:hypothetical protein
MAESGEVSIQEFLDLEMPEFMPVTNTLQNMLAKADGLVNEALAEILATMVYNLEMSLAKTKLALVKVRTACQELTAHAVNLEARLMEAGVPIHESSREETQSLIDAIRDATEEPP